MKPINDIIDLLSNDVSPIIWTDIYGTEEELLSDLLEIQIRETYPNPTKGYIYLSGFQAKLKRKEMLTEKQMAQLKRMAKSVAYEKYIRGGKYGILAFGLDR